MLLTEEEIQQKLRLGEDSFTQFKQTFTNVTSLAEELVAFTNSKGGHILVGIDDFGKIIGIDNIRNLNQLISNASSENTLPPIFPQTESKLIDDKQILIIHVPEGNQKPYRTKQGKYLAKTGADKRVVSREELLRMFQESGSLSIEELSIRGAKIEEELEKSSFYFYFEKQYEQSLIEYLDKENQTLAQILQNMNLSDGQELTLIGLMIFGRFPQKFRPIFHLKSVSFFGNRIEDTRYISSEDIDGTIESQFRKGMVFLKSNLLKIQNTKTFNSLGDLEIPEIALEEHLVNALIHRDFSINSSIKLLVFQNRIEIISPGKLPNHLSIENIKSGNSIPRNPLITSFARKLLPYRGLGSGIRRALDAHPNTELINDEDGEQFTVILHRPYV